MPDPFAETNKFTTNQTFPKEMNLAGDMRHLTYRDNTPAVTLGYDVQIGRAHV